MTSVARHNMAKTLLALGLREDAAQNLLLARQAAEEALEELTADPGTRIEAEARVTLANIDAALTKSVVSERR